MLNMDKILKQDLEEQNLKFQSLGRLVSGLEKLSDLVGMGIDPEEVIEGEREFIPMDAKVRISNSVLKEGFNIWWLYRDEPLFSGDSGWRVYSGEEDDNFLEGSNNFSNITIGELIMRDERLEEIIFAPIGTQYEWFEEYDKFIELD